MKYHFSWFPLAEPLIHAIEHLGASHDDAIRVVTSWGICIGLLLVALAARAGLKSVQGKGGTPSSSRQGPRPCRDVRAVHRRHPGHARRPAHQRRCQALLLAARRHLPLHLHQQPDVGDSGRPSPTDNINTNAAMAIVVLCVYVFEGVRRTGMHFFKHMMGPVLRSRP